MKIVRIRSKTGGHLGLILMVLTVFGVCSKGFPAGEIADEQELQEWLANYEWLHAVDKASRTSRAGRLEEAIEEYRSAVELAETEEQKAETLLHMGQVYEALSREETIKTYRRILDECPASGLVPQVCFRLGELHRSISLVPEMESEECRRVVEEEMIPARSIPFFEKGVASGKPLERYVLFSRSYLANLYHETGREEEAWGILHELASLSLVDVQAPVFAGSFTQRILPQESRLREAKDAAEKARASARRRLIAWSVDASDPTGSIARIESVAQRYPDEETILMAEKEVERLRAALAQDLREDIERIPKE